MLLVLFLPVPALILYRLIGRPRFPAWRRRRFLECALFPASATQRPGPQRSPRNAITTLAEQLGGFPCVSGNRVTFQTDYDEIVDAMVALSAENRGIASFHFVDEAMPP